MDRASASEAGNVGSTPAGRKFKTPPCVGFLFETGAGKLLCPRREEKAGAMFLFERGSAKGKNREARPGEFLRQQKYRRGPRRAQI